MVLHPDITERLYADAGYGNLFQDDEISRGLERFLWERVPLEDGALKALRDSVKGEIMRSLGEAIKIEKDGKGTKVSQELQVNQLTQAVEALIAQCENALAAYDRFVKAQKRLQQVESEISSDGNGRPSIHSLPDLRKEVRDARIEWLACFKKALSSLRDSQLLEHGDEEGPAQTLMNLIAKKAEYLKKLLANPNEPAFMHCSS